MDDKTRFEMEALITEREGMIAENYQRIHQRESIAYGDNAFNQHAEKFRALIKKPGWRGWTQ